MVDQIRITVEHIVDGNTQEETVVLDKEVESVSSISELGLNHQQQIDLMKQCQDALLKIQSKGLQSDIQCCPKCGTIQSDIQCCPKCGTKLILNWALCFTY